MNTQSLEERTVLPSPITFPATPGASSQKSPSGLHLKNILIPIDSPELSLKSLRYAVPLAKQCGARLTLVHVVEPSDYTLGFSYPVPLEEKRMKELAQKLEDLRNAGIPAELSVDVIVCQCRPSSGILNAARETCADLIIVATHGRTGLDRILLGSVAEGIVRNALCPVMVIHECERDFF